MWERLLNDGPKPLLKNKIEIGTVKSCMWEISTKIIRLLNNRALKNYGFQPICSETIQHLYDNLLPRDLDESFVSLLKDVTKSFIVFSEGVHKVWRSPTHPTHTPPKGSFSVIVTLRKTTANLFAWEDISCLDGRVGTSPWKQSKQKMVLFSEWRMSSWGFTAHTSR